MKRILIATVLAAATLAGGVAATIAPASAAPTCTSMYHHGSDGC